MEESLPAAVDTLSVELASSIGERAHTGSLERLQCCDGVRSGRFRSRVLNDLPTAARIPVRLARPTLPRRSAGIRVLPAERGSEPSEEIADVRAPPPRP